MFFSPEIRTKVRQSLTNFCEYFEFGAVRRCANLVDLEKCFKNEYLVANIGFDTAETEPRKEARPRRRRRVPQRRRRTRRTRRRRLGHDTSLFPRPVLGCINADFCNQILVLIFLHFSRSTVAPIGRKKVRALFFLPKKKIHLVESHRLA